MAKTVDLRTYLLLEKAFVRRLQRSWRLQSAPTYAKITQHCLDHEWDKARQLVPDLDMAEVGTENREWITYMLLSCAVFGANTVAKGKPSFVGVGSFDTFLKQVTTNMLQYLEFSGTARVQAEALQSIAEDEAKTKALPKVAFDATQPRNPKGTATGGQWTSDAARLGALVHLPATSPDGIHELGVKTPLNEVIKPSKWDESTADVQAALRGIQMGIASMVQAYPALQSHVFVGYMENEAMGQALTASAVQLTENSIVLFNTQKTPTEVLALLRQNNTDPETSSNVGAAGVLDPSLTPDQAIKLLYRNITVHEFGHVMDAFIGHDRIVNGRMGQRQLPSERLGIAIHEAAIAAGHGSGKIEDAEWRSHWIQTHISQYAWMGGPTETFAETFLAKHIGQLPPELTEAMRAQVKKSEAPANFPPDLQAWWQRRPKDWVDYSDNPPVTKKWEETQHPRDKDGQFTEKSLTPEGMLRQRNPPPMEGGYGGARARWEELNRAVMDADDVAFAARDAHTQIALRLEQKYPKGTSYTDYEGDDFDAYYTSKQKALEAGYAVEKAEQALKRQEPTMKKEVVRNLSNEVAEQLGVSPRMIDVVHIQAPSFMVGDKQFTEAGHYDPSNRRIELNTSNINYGDAPAVKGIAAHEMSHYIFHSLKAAADAEFERYLLKAVTPEGNHTDWYKERAQVNTEGDPFRWKPQYREAMAKEFPASAVLAQLAGGNLFTGISDEMVKENGHSAYAKSYWTPAARAMRGHTYDAAINETVAELTRWITYPKSWHENTAPSESSPWVTFTRAMHEWYQEQQEQAKQERMRLVGGQRV